MQFQPITPPFPIAQVAMAIGAGFNTPFSGVFGSGNVMIVPATRTISVPDGVVKMRARGWSGGDLAGGGFFMKVCDVTPGSQIVCTVGAATASTSFGSFCSATGASGVTPGTATGGDINFTGGAATSGTSNGGGAAANLFGPGGHGGTSSSSAGAKASGGGGYQTQTGAPSFTGAGGQSIDLQNGNAGSFNVPLNLDLIGCGPGGSGGGNGSPGWRGGPGLNGGGGGGASSASGGPILGGDGGFPGGGAGQGGNVGGTQGVGGSGLIILEW